VGGATGGELANGAVVVVAGDRCQDLRVIDLLDGDPSHVRVAVGPGDLDEEVSVVAGQGTDGLGAHPRVAVFVLRAE